jgi:kynurenine formamidase
MTRPILLALLASLLAGADLLTAQSTPPTESVPLETFEGWMRELSNTGRWGPDDQLGTLNLIDDGARYAAAQEVREGVTVSMSRPMVTDTTPSTRVPMQHRFSVAPGRGGIGFGLDQITIDYHGWSFSHIDALSHVLYRDRMYNDVSRDELLPTGARRLGIETMRDGIVTRGLIIDLPRLRGVDHMEPGDVVRRADLEEWERRTGVRARPGDVVLIRTGRWARVAALGEWRLVESAAGPHPDIAHWLRERGVAVLGSDVSNERYPTLVPPLSEPVHLLTLVAMGMPLLDNLDLERVAEAAAARGRVTFMFVAAPLPVEGGAGSPLNPLAIF